MKDDPIVAEVRAAGKKLAEDAGFDFHRLCLFLREQEKHSKARIVDRSGSAASQ